MSLFSDQPKTGTGNPVAFRCPVCGLEKPAAKDSTLRPPLYGAFKHTKEECLRQRLAMVTRALYSERGTIAKLGAKIFGQRKRLAKMEEQAKAWRPTDQQLKELRTRTERAVAEAEEATRLLKEVTARTEARVREEFRAELAQMESLRARLQACEATKKG